MTSSQILTLARAGATGRAWDAFAAAGLTHAVEPAALTLKGRLLKDRARATTEQGARAELFSQSAEAYAEAANIEPGSYPLINAATMALFAGDSAKTQKLAGQVETMIASGLDQGETPYWREATRAEALLLLGRRDDAEEAFGAGIAHAPQAWEDIATTLRQFRLISEYRNEDHGWLAQYAPPPSLHYSGLIGLSGDDLVAVDAIGDAVDVLNPGFVYGALAAGADILIAEAAVSRGAELHLILPTIPSIFRAISVEPYGAGWAERFDQLFEVSASVQILAPHRPFSHAAIAMAAEVALGRAVENAQRLESTATNLLVIAKGETADGPNPPAIRQHVLEVNRSAPVGTDNILVEAEASIWLAVEGVKHSDPPIMTHHSDMQSAITAMQSLPENITAAIDYQIVDGENDDAQQARILRMVQAAARGTIIAGSEATMALLANGARYSIEPLGEMASNDGPIALYAIRQTK